MTKEEVIATVNAFLVEDFDLDKNSIAPESLITTDLGIDSLDIIDIIVSVKEKFGFKLEKDELINVKTLADLYELIHSHVK
ncbi:MAG: phosphopantetheine-binding protein [Paludibacteraceae bacterium]|nr:phosphopantetheine-binding protein [Paludibacteraceae bacterium]